MKNITGDIIYAYQKSQSYDVWFLRYGVRQAKIFVNFRAIFYPFTHKQSAKSKFWKKEKKHREILLVYTSVPQMTIISCIISET